VDGTTNAGQIELLINIQCLSNRQLFGSTGNGRNLMIKWKAATAMARAG
jgi:hypothetical protein